MTKSRFLPALASLSVIALFAFIQPAQAEEVHHWHIKVMPRRNADRNAIAQPQTTLTPNLYSLQFSFTQAYPTIGPNSDGSDLWPCFGTDSKTANPDCPNIGDPSVQFPAGAVALGAPAYVWSLNNSSVYGNGYGCDADTNGTTSSSYLPCGQIVNWYEDDTGDTTDELLYTVVVTQGTNTIADSGTVDFGPNTTGGTTPPSDVVLYGDQNFGTWAGTTTGPNNANCTADVNYPLTSPANPGATYIVQAGKTCVDPVASSSGGAATISATIEIGTPKYVKSTSKTVCGSVPTPCYTSTWTKKYSITQKWTIWLEQTSGS
jgi:hypothetical protein